MKISATNAVFTVDLTGQPTNPGNSTNLAAETRWDVPLLVAPGQPLIYGNWKAIARRDMQRSVDGNDVTVDSARQRIENDYQVVAYHYAEDEFFHTTTGSATSPVYTEGATSVTRGFVMCMGLSPKGV